MAALTPEQREARKQRAEQRKALEQERWEQERRDRVTVAEAMRGLLRNPDSNPDQLIFALEVLENLEHYSFIPYNSFSKMQRDEKAEAQRKAFREEFSRKHPELMKEFERAKTST